MKERLYTFIYEGIGDFKTTVYTLVSALGTAIATLLSTMTQNYYNLEDLSKAIIVLSIAVIAELITGVLALRTKLSEKKAVLDPSKSKLQQWGFTEAFNKVVLYGTAVVLSVLISDLLNAPLFSFLIFTNVSIPLVFLFLALSVELIQIYFNAVDMGIDIGKRFSDFFSTFWGVLAKVRNTKE